MTNKQRVAWFVVQGYPYAHRVGKQVKYHLINSVEDLDAAIVHAQTVADVIASERALPQARVPKLCPNHPCEGAAPLCPTCMEHAFETGAYL